MAVCCITFLLATFGYSKNNLKPNLDVAQYQDSNHQSYLEIYYSLPEKALKYTLKDDGEFSCQVVLDLRIYKNQTLWADKIWKIENSIEDTLKISENSQLVDLIRYMIDEPASYRIVIRAKDIHRPETVDSSSTTIDFREFSTNDLDISDLELASKISRSQSGSRSVFYKNNYQVIPNPTGIYGEDNPKLYYYFESYNLTKNIPGHKYQTFCLIKNSDESAFDEDAAKYRTKNKVFDTSAEMGFLNILDLPSGKYSLVYGVTDSNKAVLTSGKKDFFVHNPTVFPDRLQNKREVLTFAEGSYGPLDILEEKELDEEFEHMMYLTTREQKVFYDNLQNADAKRKFILSIWQTPRPDEHYQGLAYRQIYLERVRITDEQFKSIFRKGWKSDRGRVLILYGPPSNVDRHPSRQRTLPYETWNYDYLKRQGGVIFVFVDKTGFNKYELLHSTLRDELQEPHWREMILRTTGDLQFNRIQN